jgi:hypothetical protein
MEPATRLWITFRGHVRIAADPNQTSQEQQQFSLLQPRESPSKTPPMNDFWSACLNRFEQELPAQQFNTWIKGSANRA